MGTFDSFSKVKSFYRECCASRDDPPSAEISAAFKVPDYLLSCMCLTICQSATRTSPHTIDFSSVQLNPTPAAILSDVFTIKWGLRRLTFKECGLDDQVRNMLSCTYGRADPGGMIETDVTRPSHPRLSHISLCRFKSASESTSIPLNRRVHDEGVLHS